LTGLFFCREDISSTFILDVGRLPPDYTSSHPKISNPSLSLL
jgi:hypothetical protein